MNLPMVSFCLLSHNRAAKVLITLHKILNCLNYPRELLEVIIVDNNSTDNTVEEIRKNYAADVNLIRLDENTGISGWNRGLEVATGKYVFVLDDDAFIEGNTLIECVKLMEENASIGVVACKIISPFDGLDFTRAYPTGNLSFWGCGALLRMEAIEDVGIYDESFFFQAFELEFSIRLAHKGWKIHYAHDLPVYHMTTIMLEQNDFKFYYSRRNLILIATRYFSLTGLMRTMPALIAFTFIYGRDKSLKLKLKSIWDGIITGLKSRKRLRNHLEKEYIRNFVEFAPIFLQRHVWNDRRFWVDRKMYYPDVDTPFFADTPFMWERARITGNAYNGQDWIAISGEKHWFGMHKSPSSDVEPLYVDFKYIRVNGGTFKALVSLVDDRATPTFFCLDIMDNSGNVALKNKWHVDTVDNCKEVSFEINGLSPGRYTFRFYSTGVNQDDSFAFSSLRCVNARITRDTLDE